MLWPFVCFGSSTWNKHVAVAMNKLGGLLEAQSMMLSIANSNGAVTPNKLNETLGEHSTAQHSTAQHSTAQYSTAQHTLRGTNAPVCSCN